MRGISQGLVSAGGCFLMLEWGSVILVLMGVSVFAYFLEGWALRTMDWLARHFGDESLWDFEVRLNDDDEVF